MSCLNFDLTNMDRFLLMFSKGFIILFTTTCPEVYFQLDKRFFVLSVFIWVLPLLGLWKFPRRVLIHRYGCWPLLCNLISNVRTSSHPNESDSVFHSQLHYIIQALPYHFRPKAICFQSVQRCMVISWRLHSSSLSWSFLGHKSLTNSFAWKIEEACLHTTRNRVPSFLDPCAYHTRNFFFKFWSPKPQSSWLSIDTLNGCLKFKGITTVDISTEFPQVITPNIKSASTNNLFQNMLPLVPRYEHFTFH